jgi:hypothetical protein
VTCSLVSVPARPDWLAGAATILDATSFSLAALESKGRAPATLCYDIGVQALRLLAAQMGQRRSFEPMGISWDAARSAFDVASNRMAMLGAPIRADLDESWRRFVALGRQYEAPRSQLATRLLIPTRRTACAGRSRCGPQAEPVDKQIR